MMAVSNEEFRVALAAHKEKLGVSESEFARRIGHPRETLRSWMRAGILKDSIRARIVSELPQIFGDLAAESGPQDKLTFAPDCPAQERRITHRVFGARAQGLMAEFVRILEWYLYVATEEERNSLRSNPDWNHFVELTRGLVSERAFDIAVQEGRLHAR